MIVTAVAMVSAGMLIHVWKELMYRQAIVRVMPHNATQNICQTRKGTTEKKFIL
jgi:hypothetical protein